MNGEFIKVVSYLVRPFFVCNKRYTKHILDLRCLCDRMILDSSYLSKDDKTLIEAKVGPPFGLLRRFKNGGVGSYKMTVDVLSMGFNQIRDNANTVYCNIELRPRGIIVHINQHGTRFSWVIAYHHLAVYSSKLFSIHAEGEFLKIRKDASFPLNKKFVDKMMCYKSEIKVGNPLAK